MRQFRDRLQDILDAITQIEAEQATGISPFPARKPAAKPAARLKPTS